MLAVLFVALLALGVSLRKTRDDASLNGLAIPAQVLSAVAIISVALLIVALLLVQRERAERLRLQAVLNSQTAELQAQTATATALAHDVEAARREVQTIHDLLEIARTQERVNDLHLSSTALHKEVVHREQTAISLQASQSELQVARDEFERGVADHTEELERSNHELEQFAYVASHDLQEPLRAISGCVQILEKRYAPQLDANGHQLITHTVEGVARLKELIEGLLAYSRVRRVGDELDPVSAEKALRAAVLQLESAIEEAGAAIEHEPLPTVRADESQLVQLLQNLIGNALKYRGTAAPRINISALRTGIMWVFAIRDNGIGIEPQYFDRVFSIFQRLHSRDEYSGTGIGLALCRRIVEQAGGLIWINSELGKGSTFYFSLPAGDPGNSPTAVTI